MLATAESGMEAQRDALALAARNVAAAQTAGADDRFTRLVPEFEVSNDGPFVVRLRDVHGETAHASALGEMVGVLDAQRAYEANAALFDLGKRLAEKTLEIGRS